MKKLLYAIPVLLIAACGNKKSGEQKTTETAPIEVKASTTSAAFNASFEEVLAQYYALKDALIGDDTTAANHAASALITASANVKLDELKSIDTSNIIIPTAKSYGDNITSESKGLLGETDIEQKRKSFQMISGALFDYVRTVRFDKQKVYLLHCPMAFDNTGADWISSTTEIKNPYFGKKMLTCGAVKDSVIFK